MVAAEMFRALRFDCRCSPCFASYCCAGWSTSPGMASWVMSGDGVSVAVGGREAFCEGVAGTASVLVPEVCVAVASWDGLSVVGCGDGVDGGSAVVGTSDGVFCAHPLSRTLSTNTALAVALFTCTLLIELCSLANRGEGVTPRTWVQDRLLLLWSADAQTAQHPEPEVPVPFIVEPQRDRKVPQETRARTAEKCLSGQEPDCGMITIISGRSNCRLGNQADLLAPVSKY